MGGGRRHEGGRAVGGRQGEEEKIPEREGGENEKNRWRTHHRRVILQPGGDVVESITAGSYYEPAVIRKHHRWVHLEPAVIDYHRPFETNRR